MHLHFEKNTNTKCDCSILSLSWMGKVPDDILEVRILIFFVLKLENVTLFHGKLVLREYETPNDTY